VAHLLNWVTLIAGRLKDEEGEPTVVAQFLTRFQAPIFSGVTAILLALVFARVYTRRSQDPGRLQMAAEMIIGGLYRLFEIILGPHARRFTPYLGTLFLFILVNNLMGIIPLMASSTSVINTTVALAICTFLYVQWTGIKENGPLGYLHHMAGSPRSAMEWGFSVLLFPLHLLGEFIKPMSLSLRLFGNIFGEDALIATMVVLGAGLFSFVGSWMPGLPLQFPFVFLAMLTSTIQALVFALLSTVYIALMLPHQEHEEAHGH
jgi:F-type H+-transporting ATPase subunit a